MSKADRMFLGVDLHSWEQWSIVFLAIVAVGGVGVAIATYGVIKLQRQEAATAIRQLEEYKADAGTKIAGAQERAAAAELKAEQIRQRMAPRRVNEDALLSMLAEKPRWPVVELLYADESDSMWVAVQLSTALAKAGLFNGVPKPLRGPNPNAEMETTALPVTITYGAQPSGVSITAKSAPDPDASHPAAFLRTAVAAAVKGGPPASLGRDATMRDSTLRIVVAPKD